MGFLWSCQGPVNVPVEISPALIIVKVNIGEIDTSQINGNALTSAINSLSKLAKIADEGTDTIELDSLRICLESRDGKDTVSTTLNVAALQNQQVSWSCFDSLPPRSWIILIQSFSGGKIIHNGTGILRSAPDGVEVEINLITTVRVVTEKITVADQTSK